MENNFSALKSIQELKNLLDSGAITQQEYEVLKQKIIFGNTNGNTTAISTPESPVIPARPEMPRPQVPPAPIQERIYPRAVEGIPATPEYPDQSNANLVISSAKTDSEKFNKDEPLRSVTFNEAEESTQQKPKDWLLTILISLAAILLIGLVAYYLMSDSDSERLTSKSGPETEEVISTEAPDAAAPDPAAVATESVPAEKPEETLPPAPVPVETTPTEPNTTPAASNPVVTETALPPPAAAPKVTEEEALRKIKERLQAYYSDMKSAPFSAQNHFSPAVERYYTLSGTTPQAINENINTYHFNEFQESQSSIEDGSLQLSSSGDNVYEVTYIEHGSAFRKSKGQKQETTARVRARFDKDFKLNYFRQEQLLENRFIDQ